MSRNTVLQQLAWIGGTALVLPLLLAGNYLLATRYLLRLYTSDQANASIQRHLEPMASPLVFASARGRTDPAGVPAVEFRAAIGLGSESLPETSDYLIPIDHITRASPYPPPLDVAYGRDPGYASFGYLGTEDQYHQVTQYWGEADSTPSMLHTKVKGAATGAGDYFVRYTVFLSRRLEPRPLVRDRAGQITTWDPPPPYPDIHRIEWSTYRLGSYDGIEEILFALAATSLEVVVFIVWRRRIVRANQREAVTVAT